MIVLVAGISPCGPFVPPPHPPRPTCPRSIKQFRPSDGRDPDNGVEQRLLGRFNWQASLASSRQVTVLPFQGREGWPVKHRAIVHVYTWGSECPEARRRARGVCQGRWCLLGWGGVPARPAVLAGRQSDRVGMPAV